MEHFEFQTCDEIKQEPIDEEEERNHATAESSCFAADPLPETVLKEEIIETNECVPPTNKDRTQQLKKTKVGQEENEGNRPEKGLSIMSPQRHEVESVQIKQEEPQASEYEMDFEEHFPKMPPPSDDEEADETKPEKINEEYILPIKQKAGVDLEQEPNFMAHHLLEASNSLGDSDETNDYSDVAPDSLEPMTILEVPKKSKKVHKCSFCSKIFNRKIALEYHLNSHTGERPFACDLCDKAYSRKLNLQRHRALHESDAPFTCSICQQKFRYKGKLDSHRKMSHPEDCSKCEECGRLFCDQKTLDMHKFSHVTENKCDICSKVYPNRKTLYNHRMTHTTIPKRFPCDMCSQSFYRADVMRKHRDRVHFSIPTIKRPRNPYKPFSCEICGKKLRTKFNLDYHRKTHSKKRPHTCHVCSITLPSREDFVQHKLDIHPEEKVFTCEICSISFWHRELLVKHLAKHTAPPD